MNIQNDRNVRGNIGEAEVTKNCPEKRRQQDLHFFKNGGASPKRKQVYGYLRNPRKRQILVAILNEPGISNIALAGQLHLDKSSVYGHLHQFLDEKMVECHWDGKNMCYSVTAVKCWVSFPIRGAAKEK